MIGIIQSAVDELNTRYYYRGELVDVSPDYVVNFGQLQRTGPCNDTPNFLVRFEGITNDGQYSSVPYRTQEHGVFTRGVQDIDLDKDESRFGQMYRQIVDRFAQEITRLSEQKNPSSSVHEPTQQPSNSLGSYFDIYKNLI